MAIVRARHSAVYPARFMLIAATNPCPCGYAGVQERCKCSEADMARHRRRLSGPLLDRIDLLLTMEHTGADQLALAPSTSSGRARQRVIEARERQLARLGEHGILVNAQMDATMLRKHVRLDEAGHDLLRGTRERGVLSARGQHRALRVARTISDLDGCERVKAKHLARALSWRPEAGLGGRRAA